MNYLPPPIVLLPVAALVLGAGLTLMFGGRGSQAQVARWARRSKRHAGMASWLALVRFASSWAMLVKAPAMRPSYLSAPYEAGPTALFMETRPGRALRRRALDVGDWAAKRPLGRLALRVGRWAHDLYPVRWAHAVNYGLGQSPTQYGVRVCRVGRRWLWVSPRGVILRVGGPGSGKSVNLVPSIVDAPGAVLFTSTRTDLLFTAGPRRRQLTGQEIALFNPSGVGNLASSVKFSPLHGCRSPETAYHRAEDMIGTRTGSGDAERWDRQAQRVLAVLMHAAAVLGEDMLTVSAWVSDPEKHEQTILSALYRSPAKDALIADVSQFLTTNERTQTSITSTIMPALGWLTSPTARAATEVGGDPFDVDHFLKTRGTVCLLGAQDKLMSPLLGAFTGYVARECRRLARLEPSGRLDPWCSLILDEAALVPVPLPEWTADMGGSGIHIEIAIQGRSQLETTWGRAGGETIINNSSTIMVFGAVRSGDDLESWSKLTGHRIDDEGRRIPVLSPAEVSQLRQWRALVISQAIPPAIGRIPKSWRRWDIRAARRKYHAPDVMETNYGGEEDPEGLGDD
jgi:hypothetical protein